MSTRTIHWTGLMGASISQAIGHSMSVCIFTEPSGLAVAEFTRLDPTEIANYFPKDQSIPDELKFGRVYLFNRLLVSLAARRRGYGTDLMQAVIQMADSHSFNIICEARSYRDPIRPGLSQASLVSFYQKHGFVLDRIESSYNSLLYYIHHKEKQS